MKKLTLSILFLFLTGLIYAQLKPISYADGTQKLNGLINTITAKSPAAVLILPAWMGIDQEARDAALALQQQGYLALVADIYGEGNYPADAAAAGQLAGRYKNDYQLYQHRIELALKELVKQGADAQQIVVIGYCFGGSGALEAARAKLPIQGAVSIHGNLGRGSRTDTSFNTRILVLHGADDTHVPQTEIDSFISEAKSNQSDWQMIYYANSKHTFTNPQSADYNELMAKRSWNHLLQFLQDTLR